MLLLGPRWYVDDGCHTENEWGRRWWGKKKGHEIGDDFVGTFEVDDFKAGVRCCSEDGTTCKTIGKCPRDFTSHSEAQEKCEGKGMRLCTKDELLTEICCKTGGNCDNHQVWTSTPEPSLLPFLITMYLTLIVIHHRINNDNVLKI